MTSSIIPNLQNYYTVTQQEFDSHSSYCTLLWRRGHLLVKPPGQHKQPYLPSIDTNESLVECLKHSPVKLVRIDPKIGEARVKFWADACFKAQMPLYLSIPSTNSTSQDTVFVKFLKIFIEWFIAFIFLIAASPVLLGLIALMRVYSPGSVFSQEYHVGARGKLFRAIKFRTQKVITNTSIDNLNSYQANLYNGDGEENITSLARWMRKYGLDNLPLLFNVLRGEMNLTGRRSRKLEEATRLNLEGQRQLNKMPGLAAVWQVETEATCLHLDSQIL